VADRENREVERANRRVVGLRPNRPIPAGFVRITHPTVEGETRVAEKALDHWKARGWVAAGEQAPPAPAQDPAAKTLAPRRSGAPTGQES
jgi:hypothetical protein